MATKTISIDLEAYRKLARARREPRESFSQVIRRARWPEEECRGARLLEALATLPPPPEAVADELEANQRLDSPPKDPWSRD